MFTENTQSGETIVFPSSFGKYEVNSIIGRGSTSIVALVFDKKTNKKFAAKIVSRDYLNNVNSLFLFEQELRIHKILHHPNIIELFEIIYLENLIIVILEYCNGIDLYDWIIQGGFNRPFLARRIFIQVLMSIQYLHQRKIVHMDIKPENILISNDGVVKLADFGCCLTENECIHQQYFGTLMYTAPEVILGNIKYKNKVDIWSLGVLYYVMLTTNVPWNIDDINEAKEQILTANFQIPSILDENQQKILKMCLQENPIYRPNIDELLKLECLKKDVEYLQRIFHSHVKIELPKNRSSSIIEIPKKKIKSNSPNVFKILPKINSYDINNWKLGPFNPKNTFL